MRHYEKVPFFLLSDFGCFHYFEDTFSKQDLILYASLCVMATLPRHVWKTKLYNPKNDFHVLVSPESDMLQIIQSFYDCDFKTCFGLLDHIKEYLLLDVYLAPHILELYSLIKNRAFIDYIVQFIQVKLVELVKTFPNYSLAQIEELVEHLIANGDIKMTLDKEKGVVYSMPYN